VADESVVVMKSRPEKAGNRLEDKTGTTCCHRSLIGESRDPLADSVASTILGNDDFVKDIREKYLDGKKKDRELPALRDLTRGPDIAEIKAVSEEAFPEDSRLARMVGIYLCWRFSGAKLKQIGNLYGISESGVNRSCGRLESRLEKDRHLEEELLQMVEDL